MTTYIEISSGVTTGGTARQYKDIDVQSGGTSSRSRVSSGGIEYVGSSGTSEFDVISSGGRLNLSSGATAIDDVISNSGFLSAVGTVSGASIKSGGDLFISQTYNGYVYFPGSSVSAVVSSGGQLDDDGYALGTQVLGGGSDYVGGLSIGDVVYSGGFVEDGGTVSAAQVESGGEFEVVSSILYYGGGAKANDDVVSSGGELILQTLTLSSGVTVTLTSTGLASTTLWDGGGVTLDAGGILALQSAIIDSGAVVSVAAGEVYSGSVVVSNGGLLTGAGEVCSSAGDSYPPPPDIADYGEVSGVQLGDLGGNTVALDVYGGGSVSGATLVNGALLILADASAVGLRTLGGSVLVSGGGQLVGGVIAAAGEATLLKGAEASSGTVSAGGTLFVDSGGLLKAETIGSGGALVEYAGAHVASTNVESGGDFEIVSAVISAGQTSSTQAETVAKTISGATIESGGSIGFYGLHVSGKLMLEAGGVAEDTIIFDGGAVSGPGVLGGSAEDATISGPTIVGELYAYDSNLSALTIGGVAGAGDLVLDNSAAKRVAVKSGGQIIDKYGFVTSADIYSGGQLLLSGGSTSVLTVQAGGVVSGVSAAVDSLAGLIVDAGALTGATLASGATLEVLSGGGAGLVTLSSGATAVVSSGGRASSLLISAGGRLVDQGTVVFSGTEALAGALSGAGTVIQQDGLLSLSGSLAAFTGELAISGGSVRLAQATAAGASVDFAPAPGLSASLHLASGARPADDAALSATLSDFSKTGDSVDLVGQAFVAGAAASLSGSALTLVDGSYSATFRLAGAVAADYVIASDGAGGTLIAVDQIVSSGQTSSGLYVGPASELTVESGGVASVMTVAGVAVVSSGAVASNTTTLAGGALVDDGSTYFTGSQALSGALSGGGLLYEVGGVLTQAGDGDAFTGTAIISGGVIALAKNDGFGAATIKYDALSSTLELLSGAQPASGGLFAQTLYNFDKLSQDLDLAGVPFVSGATATLSGQILTLVDGAYTASFTLSGSSDASYAPGYVVTYDSAGGTLIEVGEQVVSSGRTSSGLYVGPLTELIVQSGGVASATTVSGAEIVSSGGSAVGDAVMSGGELSVVSGGVAINPTTDAGGLLLDDGKAEFTGSQTLSGALSGGGLVYQLGAGGVLTLSGDGDGFTGSAVISGGVLALASSDNLGSATIQYDIASSTLELPYAAEPPGDGQFGPTLFNFDKVSEGVDLPDLAFVSGATATLSGHTLTLVDNGYTTSFAVSGSTASSYAPSYIVTSDGVGGTLIEAAAASSPAADPAVLAQSLAAFGDKGTLAGRATSHSALVDPFFHMARPSQTG